jgi:5-methylcytosine-specific restriction endonuclease McrA
MSDCLILNADYRPLSFLPLSTIPWQQAIKLSFLDRIHVIEYYSDWDVHSQHQTFPVPALAVTKEFMKYKKGVRFSRKGVFLRDLYTCQYCGDVFHDKDLTLDHVVPASKGGKTSWENIVTACQDCNHRKSDKIMQPKRLPFKPEYWHIVGAILKNGHFNIRHPSWERYLDISP